MNGKRLILVLIFAAAGPVTPACALDGPFKSAYKAGEVDLVNLVGTFEIVVGGPDVSVVISGRPEELKDIDVTVSGNVLRVASSKRHRDIEDDAKDYALFKISVPKGTNLSVERMIGQATVGDVQGDLKFSATSVKATIGAMKSAELRIPGSGKIRLGEVTGALAVKVSGSGTVDTASADSADVSISGSGDVNMHDIRHGLTSAISGSGDISAESVNGPVDARIAGSGSRDDRARARNAAQDLDHGPRRIHAKRRSRRSRGVGDGQRRGQARQDHR